MVDFGILCKQPVSICYSTLVVTAVVVIVVGGVIGVISVIVSVVVNNIDSVSVVTIIVIGRMGVNCFHVIIFYFLLMRAPPSSLEL